MVLEFPKLQPFQIPQGGGSRFDPSVGANATMDAARMIVSPVQRAFEQMVNARLQERAMQQEMAFKTQQAERAQQDALMLQRVQDSAALQRVEAQIAAQREQDAAKLAMSRAAGVATRDLMVPMQGGEPVYQEGAGPLSVESLLRLPAAQASEFPPITDAQAGVLGAEGVGRVATFRATERERKQNNAEQAAKDAAAQMEAQQAAADLRSWEAGVLNDDSLSDKDRVRLMRRAKLDPKGAAEEYEAIALAKQTETAKEREEERTGRFTETLGGVSSTYPSSIREPKAKDGVRRFFSEMSSDEKAAVQLAATATVARQLPGRSDMTVMDAVGLLGDSQFQGVYGQQVAEAAQNIARQFGWKPDPKREAPSPAPQGAQLEAPTAGVDDMRGMAQVVRERFGEAPQAMAASDEDLRALIKAGKREEAARLLRERYNAERQRVLRGGWPEPAKAGGAPLPSERPKPDYLGDPTGWWWK